MEKFLDVLLQILLPFMTILISIAVAFAIKYISKGFEYIEAKVGLIEDEKVRTLVANTVQDVRTMLTNEILTSGEELKKEILETSEDGKLTVEEAKEIAVKTAENVLDNLSEESMKLIDKTYGSVESFVLGQLEDIYAGLKAENKVK